LLKDLGGADKFDCWLHNQVNQAIVGNKWVY
jgi:hypothetical protein